MNEQLTIEETEILLAERLAERLDKAADRLEKAKQQEATLRQTERNMQLAYNHKCEAIKNLIAEVFTSFDGYKGMKLHDPQLNNGRHILTLDNFPEPRIPVIGAWLYIKPGNELMPEEPVVAVVSHGKKWGYVYLDDFEEFFVDELSKFIVRKFS